MLALDHLGCDFTTRQDARHQVSVENRTNILERYVDGIVGNRFPGLLAGYALYTDIAPGIVDQNIDLSKAFFNRIGVVLNDVRISEVTVDGEDVGTGLVSDLLRDGIQRFSFVERARRCRCRAVNRNVCTKSGEMGGNRPTNPTR
ncbi:uncharacterized protein METZ01_LOCUS84107 [marine metagenome]|uniref:Uncharacterized protein n=1 Tax=marine metagenome TaxID=408172 RepID=A0A381UWC8_9ZZZZ